MPHQVLINHEIQRPEATQDRPLPPRQFRRRISRQLARARKMRKVNSLLEKSRLLARLPRLLKQAPPGIEHEISLGEQTPMQLLDERRREAVIHGVGVVLVRDLI